MILGALLIISVMLTVYAWVERGNARSNYNDLIKENDKIKTDGVHSLRESHHMKTFMKAGGAEGCMRCQELLIELSGKTKELALASKMLTDKQKEQLYFTYDVLAKDITVTSVTGTGGKDQIQISFTVKNQASEARGNMLGRFRLYSKGGSTVWQKDFRPPDLQPGKTTYMQFFAPGNIKWDYYGCQIKVSKTSEATGGTPRQ